MDLSSTPLRLSLMLWLAACASSAGSGRGAEVDAASPSGDAGTGPADSSLEDVTLGPAVRELYQDPNRARQLRPMTAMLVTNARPTLQLHRPEGATNVVVQVCRDVACEQLEAELAVAGTSVRLAQPLAPRWHFWRVLSTNAEGQPVRSATWNFRVQHGEREADTAQYGGLDFNGDGFSDVVIQNVELGFRLYLGGPEGLRDRGEVLSRAFVPEGADYLTLRDLRIGDFNGDGLSDIALLRMVLSQQVSVGVVGVPRILVYRGNPAGRLEASLELSIPRVDIPRFDGAFGPWLSHAFDGNRDGYADLLVSLLVSAFEDTPPSVLLGGAQGVRLEAQHGVGFIPGLRFGHASFSTLQGPWDLDADGQEDFLRLRGISVTWSLAVGTPSPRIFRGLLDTTGGPDFLVYDAVPCDLRGRGWPSLVYGSRPQNSTRAYVRGADLSDHMDFHGGVIDRPRDPQVDCAGDLNGDGRQELLVTYPRIPPTSPREQWL
jgi:hypothetical protein